MGLTRVESAAEQLSKQLLGLRKLVIVDLRGPQSVNVEIGHIGDRAIIFHKPVAHLLNEERIVAGIADTPFGIAHQLSVLDGKVAVPFEAERRLQIKSVPAILDRAFLLEVIDIEADVIDDVVTGIGEIGGRILRAPSRTPVES